MQYRATKDNEIRTPVTGLQANCPKFPVISEHGTAKAKALTTDLKLHPLKKVNFRGS